MTLPWLRLLCREVKRREQHLQAAMITAVNVGYSGSRDNDANRTMRELLGALRKD